MHQRDPLTGEFTPAANAWRRDAPSGTRIVHHLMPPEPCPNVVGARSEILEECRGCLLYTSDAADDMQ
eukprot:2398665-Alexandrium_andersonii.AAC.1